VQSIWKWSVFGHTKTMVWIISCIHEVFGFHIKSPGRRHVYFVSLRGQRSQDNQRILVGTVHIHQEYEFLTIGRTFISLDSCDTVF